MHTAAGVHGGLSSGTSSFWAGSELSWASPGLIAATSPTSSFSGSEACDPWPAWLNIAGTAPFRMTQRSMKLTPCILHAGAAAALDEWAVLVYHLA
jgi:hypothetical protein